MPEWRRCCGSNPPFSWDLRPSPWHTHTWHCWLGQEADTRQVMVPRGKPTIIMDLIRKKSSCVRWWWTRDPQLYSAKREMRCLYSTPHLSALRSRQNKGPKISRARGSGQHQENTCSQDRRGLMYTLSSQSCNSIHKNCGGSGQTQGQEGEGGVGTKSQL